MPKVVELDHVVGEIVAEIASIQEAVRAIGESRALSLVQTKLDEATLWLGAFLVEDMS